MELNIVGTKGAGSADDPSYRYRMPRLLAKVEGRGNGVKTVVINMQEIAASLGKCRNILIGYLRLELVGKLEGA